MLELRNIVKDYEMNGSTVHALRGISLSLRESEFVAILGHSGCGKTTLLNIIGGLDQYTDGDLLINRVSTRQYRDRDWDAYRNHSVGFVFQNYNLIPHQTVLANVELALTISGVPKSERRRRAVEALEQVGLGDQLHKKPNQMSGGQMQRVAIARALVNNPEILLADEPTGALDSDTSVQVMEILKKVAQDRLVVMVTHNPELAEAYATRIVRIKDGQLVSDSDPYTPEEATPVPGRRQRVSMRLPTAFALSLNNLLTKKGRTFMTAFAGSIGIIGIALILSLSHGINRYIDQVQEDTLSSYPISIQAESTDTTALMTSLMEVQHGGDGEPERDDRVYANTIMYDMLNSMNAASVSTNNLERFKTFLDGDERIARYASAVQYTYDVPMPVYTEDSTGKVIQSDLMELMSSAMGTDETQRAMMSQYTMMDTIQLWNEMLPPTGGDGLVSEMVTGQYDLVYGSWPQSEEEIVLVVNSRNEVSDLALYALGFKDAEQLNKVTQAAMRGEQIDEQGQQSWSFEEICAKTFKLILPVEQWQAQGNGYTDLTATETGMEYLYRSSEIGIPLRISGIIRLKEDATAGMLTGAVGYTNALTRRVMDTVQHSALYQAQRADESVDVFTGLPFRTEDTHEPDEAEKAQAIADYLAGQDEQTQAEAYARVQAIPDPAWLDGVVTQQMNGLTRQQVEEQVSAEYAANMGVESEVVKGYIAEMSDEELFAQVEQTIRQAAAEQYAAQVQTQLAQLTQAQQASLWQQGTWSQTQLAQLYNDMMPPTVSDATLEENYDRLGYADLEHPDGINLYAASFADKDKIAGVIAEYNSGVPEDDQISYTDYVALLMSSITNIISGISYLLIAFVGISLVVSSIMIGIITYISVLERTREIGILRAIGASKKDVSHVFNAETLLVGLTAGLLGIGVSVLLTIPINALLHHLTDLDNLNAQLPVAGGVLLVVISMLLTYVAGLIPSRVAAKKDPVEALRSE